MPRLPTVGGDGDTWGGVLNEFLDVAHQSDGTIDAADVGNTPAGDIVATDVQAAINELDADKANVNDLLSPDGETLEQSGTELRLRQPITTFIELTEMTNPAAPAANGVRIYARDTGGKTELVAVFNSGAVQQIAIEP